jgi:hypothetical protein
VWKRVQSQASKCSLQRRGQAWCRAHKPVRPHVLFSSHALTTVHNVLAIDPCSLVSQSSRHQYL